jgi:polyisoprenoid-binding protein YceI
MRFLAPTLLATVLLSLPASPAVAIEFSAVQADRSSLTFVSTQMGVPISGRFGKFNAELAFDPDKPAGAKISIRIDLASIDAGSQDANDEVAGRDWFNIRAFPAATFVSSRLKPLGPGQYEVAGTLTIKGKSQPVAATFTFRQEGGNGVFEGSLLIKRIDFGIGDGPWADISTVANEVQVNFRLLALARPPAPAKHK